MCLKMDKGEEVGMRFFSTLIITACFVTGSGTALAGHEGKVFGDGVALGDTVKLFGLK